MEKKTILQAIRATFFEKGVSFTTIRDEVAKLTEKDKADLRCAFEAEGMFEIIAPEAQKEALATVTL